MREELGANILELRPPGKVVPNSGICGDEVQIFECEIDSWKLKKGYEGIEDVVVLTHEELEQQIANGAVNDGFTLAAFALLRARS